MGNWKSDYISAKFSPDVIPQMKKDYAKLLATHNRDSDRAFVDPQMDVIFKSDISAKIYAKNNWVFDVEVKQHLEHYLNEGLADVLPTKERVAKMLLEIAESTPVAREKILALKEYSEIMGYAKSEQEVTGATQNVILISDNGDKLSWEEKALAQQHALKATTEALLAEKNEQS